MKQFFLVSILFFAAFIPAIVVAQAPPAAPADSAATRTGMVVDSTRPPTANIVRIFPARLWTQTQLEDSVRTGIVGIHTWDLTDTLKGYTQSLGQIGKPVYQWIHAANANLIDDNNGWKNPYFGRKDYFVLSASDDIPYFDTKTPYVNIAYTQGDLRLQSVSVTASGNINPNLNVAVGHIRRKASGAHALDINENTTDHRSVYSSVYYRSTNRRYHGFATGVFNQLSEDLFGGEMRKPGSLDENSFIANNGVRLLPSISTGDRIVQSAHTSHAYCLFGRPYDSTRHRQRLTLLADAGAEAMRWRYRVRDINFSYLDENAIEALPLRGDTSDMDWGVTSTRLYADAGAGYVLDAGVFILGVKGLLGFEKQQFFESTNEYLRDTLNQQIGWQKVESTLDVPKLRTHLYLKWQQTTSSLLPYATRLETGGTADLRPDVRLQGRFLLNSANPSLFQRYGMAPYRSTWQADPTLRNQQLSHLWAALRWTAQKQWLDSLTDVSRYAQIGAFATRTDQFIGYTSKMAVRQASSSENLQWLGAEFSGRIRLARSIFAEGQFTAQRGFTNVNNTNWLKAYAQNLPNLWGKASFYYDNRDLSIAGILRTGVDVYYFSGHRPLSFDPMSGEWFPTSYWVKGYARVDAFFSAKVSKTYLFLKITHLNQGIIRPGYYTTSAWPMLIRTISFGLNWSFYD